MSTSCLIRVWARRRLNFIFFLNLSLDTMCEETSANRVPIQIAQLWQKTVQLLRSNYYYYSIAVDLAMPKARMLGIGPLKTCNKSTRWKIQASNSKLRIVIEFIIFYHSFGLDKGFCNWFYLTVAQLLCYLKDCTEPTILDSIMINIQSNLRYLIAIGNFSYILVSQLACFLPSSILPILMLKW